MTEQEAWDAVCAANEELRYARRVRFTRSLVFFDDDPRCHQAARNYCAAQQRHWAAWRVYTRIRARGRLQSVPSHVVAAA